VDQAKRFPPPAHVIICPATFNTINKLAAGIMDDYPPACSANLLCEALATRTPMLRSAGVHRMAAAAWR
jgi:phosphopantothenoylcysteine synthetase/decarboxylase